ncbi:MAG TPA: hypothetical protein VMG60_10360 [Burkholderiaceae bacterium]|nr:hypothetical protein [Burkholderiaceae bacterium]
MNLFECATASLHGTWFGRVAGMLLLGLLVSLWPGAASPAGTDAWTVAGQQGLVHFVVVPVEQAGDQAAYERAIASLCEPERTCFLNFYTNSSGASVGVPLPDAIASEATATYRRSMKNGVQIFMWSCRMQIPGKECF